MSKFVRFSALAAAALFVASCGPATEETPPATTAAPVAAAPAAAPSSAAATYAAAVNAERILAADAESESWLTNGRDYGEQRYSPLDQINTENVSQLSLAWYADIDTSRGQEATPIVVDGAMYVSTAWSHVKAYDVRTGNLLWAYDPGVDPAKGVDACCDVVNRGVAVWEGKVFVGTIDGRLIALDSRTGEEVWSQVTVDTSLPYTITGAPRIIKGQVIIGNGGAEYGVRGYITAYAADDGEQLWRYYTVPGNPADGFEQPELEMAAETWNGEWWRLGGGGTVWDAMAYDADLNLLYIGVGNGSPWNQSLRSPGGGDNLFLSSIVAINPDDGTYRWHYQTTPGETWDYTATQHIIVADLRIDGEMRRVLLQAPKNGFFYVLDAATGQLISAEKFVPASWASHIDLETDRPVEIPGARYDETGIPLVVQPGALGGHNWHPMSFSQRTNLVYLAARENPMGYSGQTDFITSERGWNTGTDFAAGGALMMQPGAPAVRAYLLAWDPVNQREAWRVPHEVANDAAGTLSTAGGLVFQGNAVGEFVAYKDDTGERLWSAMSQARIVAAPITFTVDGVQHVAVLAGGGSLPTVGAGAIGSTTRESSNNSRMLVFKIGGNAVLPSELPQEVSAAGELNPPPNAGVPNETIAHGEQVYARLCSVCHGPAAVSVAAGTFPDLRYSERLASAEAFASVVVDGELVGGGMVSFASSLEAADPEALRHYIIARANADKEAMEQ
ncbi:MAG: alcohol dehydrogenase [Gammaproteobacteria bacterium RIFCSPLOWO2_02_FULL_57_10]|nr:MAG: alcohol dehydrogenase [Gammaproteobacteria bacterium RIFCSPLOWO2_02_FULL_57_10]